MLNTKQLKQLVNEKVSLVGLLKKLHPNNSYGVKRPCFCPFHDNTSTEAAAIYRDEHTGEESLYCFAEAKHYTVTDAVVTLLKQDVFEVGEYIWGQMTTTAQNEWLNMHNYTDPITLFRTSKSETETANTTLDLDVEKFRYGKIGLNELLSSYIKNK